MRSLVRSATDFADGLSRAIEWARTCPAVFDASDFWERAKNWSRPCAGIVTEWAREGLGHLGPDSGQELLLLDLGDCPEIFRLYRPGNQEQLDMSRLHDLLLAGPVIGASDLEECLISSEDDPFGLLFGERRAELTDHNIWELNDDLLSWNAKPAREYEGNSAYFLWLTFGSFALLEPLRDASSCRQVLNGRERVYLCAGFEEIFTYLATVTRDGLQFEGEEIPLPSI